MTYSKPSRRAALTRSAVLAAIGLVAAAAVGLASSPLHLLHGDPGANAESSPSAHTGPAGTRAPGTGPARSRAAATQASSSIPRAGVPSGAGTVFDDEDPSVTNLDPTLLAAVRRAATDAADDRVTFHVNSGWRSPAYQEQLLQDAIAEYGSEEEAARWVATPQTSAHVSGDAVDLGPSKAEKWLSKHGAAYGLCQIYRNEPWHYELRRDAAGQGCPAMYADPTQDPRMQQ